MISIIPYPKELKILSGYIELQNFKEIVYPRALENLARYGQKIFDQDWDWNLAINLNTQQTKNAIILKLDPKFEIETYSLIIKPEEIEIKGSSGSGIFYGIQSFRQILFQYNLEHFSKLSSNQDFTLKCPQIEIVDSPRFSWRGFMLDEGRYFLGKETVKKTLDWMAFYKLNRLHWHLTEDQGWRIEIKKYPKLTTIGASRQGTPKLRNREVGHDGKSLSGYYTQAEIKEIIAYANERYIEIIPEIEFPGHAQAALAAYPELSCTGGPFEVSTKWGVHKEVFCLGNNLTIPFMKDILTEVCALFPSKWIHLGGDEVPKDRWNACPKCQAKIQQDQLTDAHHLQITFTNEMVAFLAEKNKQTICWNEVTDDRLDKRTISQYWKGKFENIQEFLREGGRTIISPSNKYYVDVSYQFSPLDACYNFEPVPPGTSDQITKQIMGIESEMWGEVFQTEKKMEWCALPRTLAIAESAWSTPENKNFERFLDVLTSHFRILDSFHINYASLRESNPSLWQKMKKLLKIGHNYYA